MLAQPSTEAVCNSSLTEGAVTARLLAFAWPIFCSGIVGVLDTSINAMWVGRELGASALAGISNANLLWIVLFAGQFGISTAGEVRIGRSVGRRDISSAKAELGTMITISGAVSVMSILPFMIWTFPLLAALGTPAAAMPLAAPYLRMLLISVPVYYLYGAVIAVLRATGDSRTALYFLLLSVLVDGLLNPVFIFGLGPIPRLGIAGSALATSVSYMVGLAGLVWHVYKTAFPLCLRARDVSLLKVQLPIAWTLFSEGGPMAVQFLWGSIENLLLISLVNRFGADTTAAYGAAVQLWTFMIMPAAALCVALTSMVAQNIGANRWDRVRTATVAGLSYAVVATVALVAGVEALNGRAFLIFLPAGSVALGVARDINHEATWSLIFSGMFWIWGGVLRATGAVWAPLVISAAVLAVRFPVTLHFVHHGQAHALWWSFPASAAITSALAAFCGGRRLRGRGEVPKGLPPVALKS